MRARALLNDIQNALDFLFEAELALYTNPIALTPTLVSWHDFGSLEKFLLSRSYTTVEQYLVWVRAGAYSALLRDGSLLQLTYDVKDGVIAGHRLAYVPCPVVVDQELLQEGEPLADVVPLYLDAGAPALTLQSPVRFDFDPGAARVGHPAAHFSINSTDCRVACVAPVHPYRFIDFVFRHFYPAFRRVHESWFEPAARRQLGVRVITDDDRSAVHLAWPI